MYQKKQKRQVRPCFFYSKQAVIRPRDQNAYQRDKDLQEQTKYWLCTRRFDKQKGER